MSALRDMLDAGGLRRTLVALAEECERQAESDPLMIKEWMRAANKILKLSLEVDSEL